jgi:hypothetical protein
LAERLVDELLFRGYVIDADKKGLGTIAGREVVADPV